MNTKHKKKLKHKFLTVFVLLMLCFSIIFSNSQTVEVCHALASWSPNGGFQPGISPYGPWDNVPQLPDSGTGGITIKPPATNTDGSLKAYSQLKVINDKKNTKYGGWHHAQFVDCFYVKRTDGRKIYDDDGILDVSWWNDDGNFGYSDEIIDYQSEIWVKTTVAEHGFNGFLGTVLNSKWKSGAYFNITWDRGEDPDDSLFSEIHDKDANTMGSGKYRNNGVNPGDETYKLCDWNYCSSPYITITLVGTAYWENGWWGGSYDFTDVYAFLSGFMPRSDRNWSNSLTANNKVVRQGNNLYSANAFIATASNLNNYIKINGSKVTPISDSRVLPYKEGFRIAIVDNGKTKISLEDGAEERYTDYNCIIDQDIPDVNLVYLNANALSLAKESAVSTDSDGIKSQTVTGAIFKDQLQINFGVTENESPERCYVTHNGVTKEITSGTWLKEAGNYTIVVKDLVGHTKTIKCSIDTASPSQNVDRIQGQDYKVSKWYLASIPSDFIGHGTYSYLTYNEALNKAFECEKANLVTTYELDDVNNFHNTHLVASGDTVKAGKYWYYKSIDSPSLYVYYFTEDLLNIAIEKYAKTYVSSAQYFNYKSDIYPNDYGTIIDKDIYHNLWNESKTPAYISNDFIFRKANDNESYKIYYKNIDNGQTNWSELIYNKSFKEQVNSHGLYLIKEIDYVGHETYCYVFLDLQAPMLDVTAKVYGSNDSFNHTISKNDIPANNELIFYYEDFVINKIIDDDTWYVLQVKCPNGKVLRYTYDDNLPNFDELGTGEYQITTYDRIGNNFTFKLCLLGKAPKVKFETINANEQLKISITSGEQFNEITDLKIYRNDELLNSELGYDEYSNDDSNELIFISNSIKQYLFNKGGLYRVEITDNFGRTTSHEFKFEKDLPIGVLKGVKHNGRTNKNVEFIFNSTKYTAVAYENGNPIFPPSTLNDANILTTLTFSASDKINNEYKIYLYDNNDFENLNIYKFTIKTIPPEFTLYGVNDSGTTSTDVYALWDAQSGYKATYKLNDGEEIQYLNGQILSNEGVYIITLIDDLGNKNSKVFEIDKTLDFDIYEDNIKKEIEEIRYTNKNIQISANEPLNIEITRNSEPYTYQFGTFFNDEGFYLVKIFDDFGNVKYFEFEIDKTPPVAEIIGVENKGTTNGFVQVVWEEDNLTSTIYKDGNYLGNYTSGSEIKLNGNYKVKVSDRAGNFIEFEFKIDNKIEFDINTFNGGISNGGVRVVAKEELTIEMYKDGEKIDYNFEQILNDDGNYAFILTDVLGNQTGFSFTIWNKPINRIQRKFNDQIEIKEIIFNEEIQELDIQDNTLYLVDEGLYQVTVLDKTVNKNFTFNLTLDTTPPTIDLVGTENGGYTKSEVSTRNPSENPIYIYASNDDGEFEYKLGEKMKDAGKYQLVVVDEAGNKTVYEFTIVYSFNGATIALFGALLAVVVILIIFLVKNKVGYYKNKTEITEIEETTEEIDSIEKK